VTAHIFFGKPINADTATGLVAACRNLIGERAKVADGAPQGPLLWSDFRVEISSPGGEVGPAFSMFNELIGMSIPVHTHNAGQVDSSAIMPFMAGTRRTASPMSAFVFHQSTWTFGATATTQTAIQMQDAVRWLETYDAMIAETVASRSATLKKEDVLSMMRAGTLVTPADALKVGLIHAIEECRTPRDARSWQV
jgi:ATP-dependent Clp protease protease subunit